MRGNPGVFPACFLRRTTWMPASSLFAAERGLHRVQSGSDPHPVESARVIYHLINRRLSKRQQMRWSINGAHYLLQARVELLDGKLEARFIDKYPHFR